VAETMSAQVPVLETSRLRPDAGSEEQFYSSYEWALDPVLSVLDLFERLRESLNQLNSLNVPWQIEECKANAYLFACGLACTVDDYLGETSPDLSKISRRFPRLRIPLLAVQKIVNAFHRLATFSQKSLAARWRESPPSNN